MSTVEPRYRGVFVEADRVHQDDGTTLGVVTVRYAALHTVIVNGELCWRMTSAEANALRAELDRALLSFRLETKP